MRPLYKQGDDDNIHGNFVVNFAGNVDHFKKPAQTVTDAGAVSLSVCGTSLSGQAAHITVSDIGACSGK